MSQNSTILNFLTRGRKLTTSLAESWGIVNPRARIAELRAEGYPIYTNRTKSGTYYKLGKPTKEMIRLAYAVGGQEVFGGR
jgi:hypothetical protein